MSLLNLPCELLLQILHESQLSCLDLRLLRLVHPRMDNVIAESFCRALSIDLCMQSTGDKTCTETIRIGSSGAEASVDSLKRMAVGVKQLSIDAMLKSRRASLQRLLSRRSSDDQVTRTSSIVDLLESMKMLEGVKLHIQDKAIAHKNYAPLLNFLNTSAKEKNIRIEISLDIPPRDAVPIYTLTSAIRRNIPNLHSLELRCRKPESGQASSYHESAEALGQLLPELHRLDTLDVGNSDPRSTMDMDVVLEHAFSCFSSAIPLALRSLKLTNGHFPIFNANIRRLSNLRHLSENILAALVYERLSESNMSMGDTFYPLLAANGILLESLDISECGRGLLQYLRFEPLAGTLTHLTLDCPVGHTYDGGGEVLAGEFWRNVLPLHKDSMKCLAITPFHVGGWCYTPNSPCSATLKECSALETVGLCPVMPGKVYVSDFLATLAKSKSAVSLKEVKVEPMWSGSSVVESCRKALDKNAKATRIVPPKDDKVVVPEDGCWVYTFEGLLGAKVLVGLEMGVIEEMQISQMLREAGFS